MSVQWFKMLGRHYEIPFNSISPKIQKTLEYHQSMFGESGRYELNFETFDLASVRPMFRIGLLTALQCGVPIQAEVNVRVNVWNRSSLSYKLTIPNTGPVPGSAVHRYFKAHRRAYVAHAQELHLGSD
jgi:hypothetical protein